MTAPDDAEQAPPDLTATAIEWEDLTPPLSDDARQAVKLLNEEFDRLSREEAEKLIEIVAENGNEVISRFDGSKVSIRGYLVPLDFSTKKATEFVLVPFLGACIHVPPPPPSSEGDRSIEWARLGLRLPPPGQSGALGRSMGGAPRGSAHPPLPGGLGQPRPARDDASADPGPSASATGADPGDARERAGCTYHASTSGRPGRPAAAV